MNWLKAYGIMTAILFYFLGQAIFISLTFKSYYGYIPWLTFIGLYMGFIFFYRENHKE